MEDMYQCPECRAEHSEPYDAVLGHVALCMTCVMLAEVAAEERQAVQAELLAIRVAA